MADSDAFHWLCCELEHATSLNTLESRGTVRIALKQAGLDATTVAREQVEVVLEKVVPNELEARGIENGAAICRDLVGRLASADLGTHAGADSPEAVFQRLGG